MLCVLFSYSAILVQLKLATNQLSKSTSEATTTTTIIIDHRAGEIIRLVVSVCVSVR